MISKIFNGSHCIANLDYICVKEFLKLNKLRKVLKLFTKCYVSCILSVASIRRKLLKKTHTEERSCPYKFKTLQYSLRIVRN